MSDRINPAEVAALTAPYPNIDRGDFVQNLLSRKEFYSLKVEDHNFRVGREADPLEGKFLKIHSHQLFTANIMNPDTQYKRLHLMHGTGTGKTIAAITIAMKFIEVYAKLWRAAVVGARQTYSELDRITPTIFVLGFAPTRAAFQRDLLKYPEFGFVSVSEREELTKLQRAAAAGLPDDVKHYRDYRMHLLKRITIKSSNGFFKFYGYDEFVNRLFSSDTVKLTDLQDEVLRRRDGKTLEQIIAEHIDAGTITVNTALLAQFQNSLIICDEVHNTYNTNMKNNRGVALQYILDSHPTLRAITMSATPISNSPTEVVELLNYLVPADQKITKRDVFANPHEVRPGGYEIIERLSRGRISFLQDSDVRYFPTRVLAGSPLVLPDDVAGMRAGDELPYLRFIECPMSPLHLATWDALVVESREKAAAATEEAAPSSEELDEDEEPPIDDTATRIPADGQALYDIVFPNPSSEDATAAETGAATTGVYRSRQIARINIASQKWRDENRIALVRQGQFNNVITGQFLHRDNLGKYSTKYERMIKYILDVQRGAAGDISAARKMMVYHNQVNVSGVLLIQEIARINGFIDEWSEPTDGTVCALCGSKFADHTAAVEAAAEHSTMMVSPGAAPHVYYPARYIIAHGYIDKNSIENSLAKFNAPSNARGTEFQLMIGSKVVKEGYDFKDVQELLIMSLPTNIPTLIQVFGRCVRKNSHENLPPRDRRVNVNIFISTIGNAAHQRRISPEIYRYADKLVYYQVIQRIEYTIIRSAIDGDIHRDIIMPPEMLEQYFGPGIAPSDRSEATANRTIGNLYFEPTATVALNGAAPNTTTFTAYRHYQAEIATIMMIIKRLFLTQPVWKYVDLWAEVRSPPFGVETNPALFAENNFVIALSWLVNDTTPIMSRDVERLSELALTLKVFDSATRDIFRGGRRHRIEQVGEFYILFPMGEVELHPLTIVHAVSEHVRDKTQTAVRELTKLGEKILVDVETYLRSERRASGVRVDVVRYVKEAKSGANYELYRQSFIEWFGKLGAITTDKMLPMLTNYSAGFQSTIIEEAIEHALFGDGSSATEQTPPNLFAAVLELYSQFGIIVTIGEVRKYRDTAKQFRWGVPQMPDSTPIGYTRARSVRLFDPQVENLSRKKAATLDMAEVESRWFDINKLALNRHASYRENTIIIGYLEGAPDDTMRFKLRKPSQLIRANLDREIEMRRISRESGIRMTVVDTRLVERGIVCTTKSKRELIQICTSLKITIPDPTIKIRELCELIKTSLIESEMAERQRDSKTKYLYGWWDELPTLV